MTAAVRDDGLTGGDSRRAARDTAMSGAAGGAL